jgi:hypothetical protein
MSMRPSGPNRVDSGEMDSILCGDSNKEVFDNPRWWSSSSLADVFEVKGDQSGMWTTFNLRIYGSSRFDF